MKLIYYITHVNKLHGIHAYLLKNPLCNTDVSFVLSYAMENMMKPIKYQYATSSYTTTTVGDTSGMYIFHDVGTSHQISGNSRI